MDETRAPDDLPPLATLTYKGTVSRRTMVAETGDPAPPESAAEAPTYAPTDRRTPTAASTPQERRGFRMVRRVAAGGMGEVWEAVQESLGRVVAIKVVRPDRLRQGESLAAELTEEFRREAFFAARLEHPNIVPVHELGDDGGGSPLLAMKLVQGKPWDKALAEDLDTLEPAHVIARNLPILIAMAQAVAFAHSRGVVHRDLKPGQVMLGEFGEVLLLDWGLAVYVGSPDEREHSRRIGLPDLADTSSASNPSGTPALMAPEQTQKTASGVGTWTDVYLLGGTLYFILTGSYPHEDVSAARSFMRAAFGVVKPPSERKPGRDIPPDLEALCMSALNPDPAKRCPSALAFIDALKDHLSGESRRREARALLAAVRDDLESPSPDYGIYSAAAARAAQAAALWPGSAELGDLKARVHEGHAELALRNGDLVLARLQAANLELAPARDALLARVENAERLARRRAQTRRMAIMSTFALLGLIIAGGAAFANKLAQSRDAEVTQRRSAEEARDLAADARAKSDEFARFVLEDMTRQLAELERLDLLDPAIARAHEYYRSLPLDRLPTEQRLSAARGLVSVAETARRRGNSDLQEKAVADAQAILAGIPAADAAQPAWLEQRANLLSENHYLLYRRGDVPGSIAAAREAVGAAEQWLAADPSATGAEMLLVQSLSSLGTSLSQVGDHDAAGPVLARAVEFQETLLAGTPADALALQSEMASTLRTLMVTQQQTTVAGDPADTADRIARLADAVETTGRDSMELMGNTGAALVASGEWHYHSGNTQLAIRDGERALAFLARADEIEPAMPIIASHKLNAVSVVASSYRRTGDLEAARVISMGALATADALRARDPGNTIWASQELSLLNNLGALLMSMGRIEEADTLSLRGLERAAMVYEKSPDVVLAARSYPLAHSRRAAVLFKLGRNEEALEVARKGVALADDLAARFPDEALIAGDPAVLRTFEAGALENLGRLDECIAVLEQVVALAERGTAKTPQLANSWVTLADSLSYLANKLREAGRQEQSVAANRRAMEAQRRVLTIDPARVDVSLDLARVLQRLGVAALAEGRIPEGIRDLEEAKALVGDVNIRAPELPRLQATRSIVAHVLGRTLVEMGEETRARAAADEVSATLRDYLAQADLAKPADRYEADNQRDRVAISELNFGNTDGSLAAVAELRASRAEVAEPALRDSVLAAIVDEREARVLTEQGRTTDALALLDRALARQRQLIDENPDEAELLSEPGYTLTSIAAAHLFAGDSARAESASAEAAATIRARSKQDHSNLRTKEHLARALRSQAEALVALGRAEEALAVADDALAQLPVPGQGTMIPLRAAVETVRARALSAAGRNPEALELVAVIEARLPPGESPEATAFRDREFWAAAAEIREAAGDMDGARATWERVALGFTPRPARAFTLRQEALHAIALAKLGRRAEAEAIRDRLRAAGVTHPPLERALAP